MTAERTFVIGREYLTLVNEAADCAYKAFLLGGRRLWLDVFLIDVVCYRVAITDNACFGDLRGKERVRAVVFRVDDLSGDESVHVLGEIYKTVLAARKLYRCVGDLFLVTSAHKSEILVCLERSLVCEHRYIEFAGSKHHIVGEIFLVHRDCYAAGIVRQQLSRVDDAAVVTSVLVGCEKSLYPEIEPILRYMGTTVIHMGENGKGLVMKICQNTLVGEIQNGVNETLLMALHYGISIDNFAAAVAAGGANCAYMAVQKDKLKNEDYSVAFSFENMNKDIHICERMAADAGMEMPGMQNVKRVFEKGMSAGLAKEDFRATYKVVRGDYDD